LRGVAFRRQEKETTVTARGDTPAMQQVYDTAPFGLRVAAFLVDLVALYVLVAIGSYVLFLISLPFNPHSSVVVTVALLWTGQLAFASLYFIVPWWGPGRTLGQKACGLYVVRAADGEPLGLLAAATRWAVIFLVQWLSVLVLILMFPRWWGVLYLGLSAWWIVLILTTYRDVMGRGLHDRVAGSRVVRVVVAPAPPGN
jgi:hypothetical protein